ncbi:IclR family transcriptional regulator [Nocardioides marmoriginsengisoli]|uniref:IclR family transcriptional regulator n=1 Tax=Nocardioides marmoriginsengisoli TaxID=661483 RepID=A0A3N0CGD2_9ACTN|nr:IclR family transcriptional regulator [Nocardioides marmoriginsengisoli]
MAILDMVTAAPEPIKVAELAAALAIPRNSAYELVGTLADARLVNVLDGGTLVPGPRLLEWGSAYARGIDLVSEAAALAGGFARRADSTVHVARLDGEDVVYLVKEEGSQHIRMGSEVGGRVPAHATGVGKAILGALPPEELSAFLRRSPLDRLTPSTIVDADLLRADIASVARLGVAYDREESSRDVCCVASPVRDSNGTVVAGISISTLANRMTPETEERLSVLVVEAARELSSRLGYVSPGEIHDEGNEQ